MLREEIPLVDRAQYLAILHALGGNLDQLIHEFFSDCERFSQRLVGLATAGDITGFHEVCHEIKGAAAILGFTGISGCATRWETLSASGRLPQLEIIKGEFSNFVEATQRWFEDAP